MAFKLQGIRRDFEYDRMRNGESLSDYLTKVFGLIRQMKMYDEDLHNKRVVRKLSISLTPQYDNIVDVKEEAKNTKEIDPAEVVATLKGFEQILIRHSKDSEVTERAFSSLSVRGRNNTQSSGIKTRSLGKTRGRNHLWNQLRKVMQLLRPVPEIRVFQFSKV